ncbi:MAG: NADP-dependent phosphogluconate dehydrogenase [Bacteroidia bacterium]
MTNEIAEYGMIGLGTMGRNLLYNMNDKGYSVAGFDKNKSQVELLKKEGKDKTIFATADLSEFVKSLKTPRVIILLVPAGKIVDDVIAELKPLLSKDDLIMDCGNSHYIDTDKRIKELAKSNLQFMGVGVSGGEYGARNGPSIMPGGAKEVYARVQKMLASISAKVNNEPCVTWLGPGSAGHYVKMVHNGIEYGLMQLIAESYHLLKVLGNLDNDELHTVFSKWNNDKLHSYLIQITADIFTQKDDLTSAYLVDMILDSAHQKGTGAWTSEDAMKIQVPVPVIDSAVSTRDLSAYKKEREAAAKKLGEPYLPEDDKYEKEDIIYLVEEALYFSMIITYAQGMVLLQAASKEYEYDLKLQRIASIWRGGCIIRASLLEEIHTAFSNQPNLPNLLMDDEFSKKLVIMQNSIRELIQISVRNGVPVPAFMSSLTYFDGYRSAWLPANLLQAQRDYFGAHTYERIDRAGTFHTNWNQTKDE